MADISITLLDDAQIANALTQLDARAANLEPAFELIGSSLVTATQMRFEHEEAPSGEHWAPNAASTLARKLRRGAQRILQQGGFLLQSITYLASQLELAVGTNRIYAAIQQLGGTDDMAPGPAAIPARPFLGLSSDDEGMIGRTLGQHLELGS